MTKLRVGVIGTGSIAGCHLDAYLDNPDVDLVAVCDMNLERAKNVADRYHAQRAYGEVDEMLADPEIDAVSICTWNNTHAEFAIKAIEAGKHVLVEKPLSRTYAEAQAVEKAVAGSDRVLQVGFVRRHSPNCQVLKSFIDEGELGEIYYAKASCIRRMGNPGGWFADKEISGGGPLIDIGVHVIDLCWYLMGSPKAVSVSANAYNKLGNRSHIKTMPRYRAADYDPEKNSVEDMVNALVRFENGASLLLETSYSLHAPKDNLSVSVYGDKGGADLEPGLMIATEKHQTILNVTPQLASSTFQLKEGFQNEIDNFVAACRGEAEGLSPAWHGAEIMKIMDAIYASAESGREVSLV
ncbi:Gfo/Idh/MocA family oxidoreductase [Microlunatus panaciterrae]|uniref:Dehydrogenase n=1 Tax=Microlunatus panaciterrae TaxID=400768 RepID=A0ABS2RJU7_9ACTN|nr:Gfo/Idh/MocA family oxidoreductase [Microlunatus panaciterrae]MBM7799284.1 putative dehydrogenase [Microlunatus panaciterrae]